jgi:hypothetical protein
MLAQLPPALQSARVACVRAPRSRARSLAARAMAAPVVKTYRLDASSEGCTGLFFRKKLSNGSFATDGDSNWPRNGFVFQGVEAEPGWVQLSDRPEKWLPVKGHGHVYLHEEAK